MWGAHGPDVPDICTIIVEGTHFLLNVNMQQEEEEEKTSYEQEEEDGEGEGFIINMVFIQFLSLMQQEVCKCSIGEIFKFKRPNSYPT